MNVETLRTLLPLAPSIAKSVGVPEEVVADIQKQIEQHTPYLLEMFELTQQYTQADRRKRRYRRVREEASITALHALVHHRADLVQGPAAFASLANQSLALGQAFAEAWCKQLEELEAAEELALKELAELAEQARNASSGEVATA